jgi:hypothetical protein
MHAITVVFDVTLPMFLTFQDLTRPIRRVGWSQYNYQLLNINYVVYVEFIGKHLNKEFLRYFVTFYYRRINHNFIELTSYAYWANFLDTK